MNNALSEATTLEIQYRSLVRCGYVFAKIILNSVLVQLYTFSDFKNALFSFTSLSSDYFVHN